MLLWVVEKEQGSHLVGEEEEVGPAWSCLNLLLPSRSAQAGWMAKAILPMTLSPATATRAGAIHLST